MRKKRRRRKGRRKRRSDYFDSQVTGPVQNRHKISPQFLCISCIPYRKVLSHVHSTIYDVHCTMYTEHRTLYSVRRTDSTLLVYLYTIVDNDSILNTVYTVYIHLLYTIHHALYTVYTVQCTAEVDRVDN